MGYEPIAVQQGVTLLVGFATLFKLYGWGRLVTYCRGRQQRLREQRREQRRLYLEEILSVLAAQQPGATDEDISESVETLDRLRARIAERNEGKHDAERVPSIPRLVRSTAVQQPQRV